MKRKILILSLVVSLMAGVSAGAEIHIENGVLDREFDENKTLYYVNISSDEIPSIEAEGYTLEKQATIPYDGNALTEENTTILVKNDTGERYRFVFEKRKSGFEITNLALSADGKLTVSGNVDEGTALKMFIMRPKEAFSEETYQFDEADNTAMEKAVLDMVSVNDTGDNLIEYKFPAKAVSGQYGFLFAADGVDKTYYTTRFYMSENDIENAINELNEKIKFEGENTPEALKEFVEKNYRALYLDMTKYNELSENPKLVAIKALENDNDYSSADEIGTAFYKGVAVAWIYDNKSPSEILTEYNKYLLLEMYDNYNLLENKSVVDKKIAGKDNEKDIRELFNKAVPVAMINEAEPSQMKTIIQNYQEYLGLDSDMYDYFIKNSDKCAQALGNKNFNDAEEINDVIQEIKNKNTSGSGSGGGSGSGSGGGSGNSYGGGISTQLPSVNTNYVAPTTQQPAEVENPPENQNNTNLPFTDIQNVSWAHKAIEYLYNNKILNGKSENSFAPDDYVKREEFVKLVVNAFGLSAEGEITFNDVNSNDWYYDYLISAANLGVVNGISETEFGVGKNITREDIAVMIYRAVTTSGIDTDIIVEDIPELTDLDTVSEYAKEAVEFMIEKGAINGIDGEFRPHEYATRAQTAQMLYQIIKIR